MKKSAETFHRVDEFKYHSRRLDPFQRSAICRLGKEGKSVLEIFDVFFGNDTTKISLKHLKHLLNFFSTALQEDIDLYLV
jgi:hypothetical protein